MRILERPVVNSCTRNNRPLIAAAHRDDDLRPAREFVGQPCRRGMAQIDPHFFHDRYHFRMDPRTRISSCRNRSCFRWIGQLVEEGSGDLGSTGVMDAGEKDRHQSATLPGYTQQSGLQHEVCVVGFLARTNADANLPAAALAASRVMPACVNIADASAGS